MNVILDFDDCPAINPCKNGGTCVDDLNSYHCDCASGYTGATCQLSDFCASGPCKHNSTCANTGTGFSCTCSPGFTGIICDESPAILSVTQILSGVDSISANVENGIRKTVVSSLGVTYEQVWLIICLH